MSVRLPAPHYPRAGHNGPQTRPRHRLPGLELQQPRGWRGTGRSFSTSVSVSETEPLENAAVIVQGAVAVLKQVARNV